MELQSIFPAIVLLLALTISLVLATETKVEPSVYKTLEESGRVNIFVSFVKNNIDNIRNQVTVQTYATRGNRINSLYKALKQHADTTQSAVLKALNSYSRTLQENSTVKISSFWITNQVFIKNADSKLIEQLSTMEDISEITKEQVYFIGKPSRNSSQERSIQAESQWGVEMSGAPKVWATGNLGADIVVAIIDTGVRGTHEALRDGFRKEHGWLDPIEGTQEPTDRNGHGTHVAGTIVGRIGGIGMAPAARWIACRAADGAELYTSAIITCAEWTIRPTDSNGNNPDFSLAPHVINNSWGSNGEHNYFDAIIEAWETAGITVVFSAGNTGPGCGTVGSPGTHPKVISVGSVDESNRVSDFSSRGPSNLYGTVQPDVAAPGSRISSASYTNDNLYVEMRGTSMAAPHVAGLAVLLKSERPTLTVGEIRTLILAGAQSSSVSGQFCGGRDDARYPNNIVGYGKVDAYKSIEAIKTLGSSSLKVAATLKQHEFFAFSLLILVALKSLII